MSKTWQSRNKKSDYDDMIWLLGGVANLDMCDKKNFKILLKQLRIQNNMAEMVTRRLVYKNSSDNCVKYGRKGYCKFHLCTYILKE